MTIDSKNSTYTAALLFRSLRNGIFLPQNLWEESIVLICAATREEAEQKAEEIGRARKLSYVTGDDVELTWEFYKVEEYLTLTNHLSMGLSSSLVTYEMQKWRVC